MLKIGRMVLGMVQTNCYFLYEEGCTETIIVDPADKGDEIYKKMTEAGFRVAGILLTHGHFDHIMGAPKLRELTGARIYALDAEKEVCEDPHVNCSAQTGRPCSVKADVYVKDGEEIELAGITFHVIATPGHTKGSCCYYFEQDEVLLSGDTLFAESVGRTDLPTGSMGELTRSLRDKLAVLPESVRVYPGHESKTTIGHEKAYNPYWA